MSILKEIRRISSEYGFSQRRSLSQCFLIDGRILDREAATAGVEGKTVLEVGAGLGFLTRRLAESRAKEVIAIEKDARLIPILEAELAPYPNVRIVHADFLKWEPEKFDVFVSNIPYSISSPLLFRLAELEFIRAVVCLQKEFVERMLAQPGEKEYSRLSVTSQARFRIRHLGRIHRTCFRPSPQVDSALVELVPTGKKLTPETEKLIMLLFQHRKKTLRAALSDSAEPLGITKDGAHKLAEKSGLSERRVFTLAEKEFIALASLL